MLVKLSRSLGCLLYACGSVPGLQQFRRFRHPLGLLTFVGGFMKGPQKGRTVDLVTDAKKVLSFPLRIHETGASIPQLLVEFY